MRYSSVIAIALAALAHHTTQRPSLAGCYVLAWPDSMTRDSSWRNTFVDSLRLIPPFDSLSPTNQLPVALINTPGTERDRWARLTWASWQPLTADSFHITLSTNYTQWDLDLRRHGRLVEGEGTYAVGDGLEGPVLIHGSQVPCATGRRAPN